MIITEAQRLFLRCFHVADLDAMMAVFGDAEVVRFGAGPQSRDWVQTWLLGCVEDYYRKSLSILLPLAGAAWFSLGSRTKGRLMRSP